MAQFRVVLNFMVAGALMGILFVSLVGPRYIAWDNTAGQGMNAMCLCQDSARQGADRMISFQMTGSGIGTVFGALLGITFVVMMRRRQAVAPKTV